MVQPALRLGLIVVGSRALFRGHAYPCKMHASRSHRSWSLPASSALNFLRRWKAFRWRLPGEVGTL